MYQLFNELILAGLWCFVEAKINYFWRETGSVTTVQAAVWEHRRK